MSDPSVLLVHKIPAFWESEARADPNYCIGEKSDFPQIENLSLEEKDLLYNLESDIFFILARDIAEYLSVSKVNVILGQDPSEVRNWEVVSRNGKIEQEDKFIFWSTDSPQILPEIEDVEVLILRGNYPNFHNKLIEKYNPAVSVLYPATSLFFPHFSERMRALISPVLKGQVPQQTISQQLEEISKQSAFSKIKTPKISEKPSDLELMEFRKLFRNYLESCIKKSNEIRERISPGRYSIVLYDEQSNYDSLSKIYPESRLLKFNKAASPSFYFNINSHRKYDILFTGTTIQKTKNHNLFYEIVDGLVSSNHDISIAIVGASEGIEELKKRWGGNVEIFERVSKSVLCDIYNNSRFHLITSGRDCFPRTIPESIVCGCHLLVIDILSDGISLIEENPLIGTVIDSSNEILSMEPSYSVSLQLSTNQIISRIVDLISVERDHLLIAALGQDLFSVDSMIQLDMIWQEIDLSLR